VHVACCSALAAAEQVQVVRRARSSDNAADCSAHRAARPAGAIVMTKDVDFVQLVERFGPPPSLIWLSCARRIMQQRLAR
jgi:predicted nuclease of predicted toxin-antitoxin system